jgi:hypothetical protein
LAKGIGDAKRVGDKKALGRGMKREQEERANHPEGWERIPLDPPGHRKRVCCVSGHVFNPK